MSANTPKVPTGIPPAPVGDVGEQTELDVRAREAGREQLAAALGKQREVVRLLGEVDVVPGRTFQRAGQLADELEHLVIGRPPLPPFGWKRRLERKGGGSDPAGEEG